MSVVCAFGGRVSPKGFENRKFMAVAALVGRADTRIHTLYEYPLGKTSRTLLVGIMLL